MKKYILSLPLRLAFPITLAISNFLVIHMTDQNKSDDILLLFFTLTTIFLIPNIYILTFSIIYSPLFSIVNCLIYSNQGTGELYIIFILLNLLFICYACFYGYYLQFFEVRDKVLRYIKFVKGRDIKNHLFPEDHFTNNCLKCKCDINGKLISAKFKNGSWCKYEYDAQGNKIKEVNSNGDCLEYQYDTNSNLVYKAECYANGNIKTLYDYDKTSYDYGKDEFLYGVLYGAPFDSNVIIYDYVKYEYDENGNIIKFVNRSGGWKKTDYDERGNKIKEEYSNGSWWKYEYDERGNKIKEENSDNNLLDKIFISIIATIRKIFNT